MAMLISVNPEYQADPNYRYKMQRVQLESQGGKTIMCNIDDISSRLCRHPEYLARYLSHKLSLAIVLKGDKRILKGSCTADNVQRCVYEFIQKFVLCERCPCPETVIRLEGQNVLLLDCRSCGHSRPLSSREKIYNLIVKTEKAKMKKETVKETAQGKDDDVDDEDCDEEDQSETSSAPGHEMLVSLKRFLHDNLDATAAEFADEVHVLQQKHRIDASEDFLPILFEALFDKRIFRQLPGRQEMMAQFVSTESGKHVIRSLMLLCSKEATLLNHFGDLLKEMYDVDLIDEGSILKWFKRKNAPAGIDRAQLLSFKKASAPFITWLQDQQEDQQFCTAGQDYGGFILRGPNIGEGLMSGWVS